MQKARFNFLSVFTLALLAIALAPQRVGAQDVDPPGRVARLAQIEGAVSFQPAGTDDWVSALVNRPMTTGDKLWSDNNSRAELHIGSASIRLSSNTGFSFLNLTDQVAQLQLTAGTLRIRVKRLAENETFEVDTPNLAFSILRPGIYKLNVNENGDATMIVVRSGEGEVTGGGAAYAVHSGEAGTFVGTDQLGADLQNYNNPDDDFDQWCSQRDRREDISTSARYVSPDVIGYEDLDQYGAWRPVPQYGMVWFPQPMVVGWAPYQYGHWAYVYPWGYTWVDDAPWGFAPFHYGRWIFVGGAWGWVPAPPPAPGVVYIRPVYAPALVAWVGGPHFAVGIGVGGFAPGVSVGWFPLGPREVFVPSYPVSRTYITNVNVSNTVVSTTVVNNYYNTVVVNKTVVNQTFVNQRVPGAVVVTSPQAFTSAQPVYRNVVHIDEREIVSAPVNVAAPAIAPPKQAVLGAGTPAGVRPPAFVQNRAVVAKLPPPPPPVSFARQQQAIQANGGKPLAISQTRQLQPQAAGEGHPNVRIAPQVNSQNNHGNISVQGQPGGPPGPGNNSGQPGAGGNAGSPSNNGYRKFSDRPPSAQPNSGNSSGAQGNNGGQPAAGGNGGSQGSQGYRTFSDRPNQPNSGNNTGQSPNNNGELQGKNGGQPAVSGNGGNQANQGYRTFEDRPPSSRPNGGSSGAGSGNAESTHQQQPEHVQPEQRYPSQEQNASPKSADSGASQPEGKKADSKSSKDDNKGRDQNKTDEEHKRDK